MSPWYSPAGTAAPKAWAAVRVRPDLAIGARCVPAAPGARPRVQLSPALRGDDPAARLWPWLRGFGRQTATCLVLPARDYRIVPTEAPGVPAAERRQALRWQIRDQLDYPAEQAVVDGLSIPVATAGASAQRMYAVAAHADTVRGWMQAARTARVALRAIDIPETALRNLAVLAAGERAHALLHLGLRSARLVIVWQGELCALRQLDLSASALAAASADERAEQVERIALEVQRTADAFARQFQGVRPEALWICAASADDALVPALTELLALPVRPFAADEHLDLADGRGLYDAAAAVDYTLVVGAALRQ
jgi:MSHA biogenesis protein MshI